VLTPAALKRRLKATRAYALWKSARTRRELARWTDQDERMKAFYRAFVSPGDLVFDVGANVGNRVKIFLALGARVVAVEPQRGCAETLRAAFGSDPRFALVEKALGESEGTAEMLISDADTFSSLSRDWVSAVGRSGRFRGRTWDRKATVEVSTLDRLIAEHGSPAFVKIDVGGFEYEVVKGLSRPVRALSLEYAPEAQGSMRRCLDHLDRLGDLRLNYSPEESMSLALDAWVSRRELEDYLTRLGDDLSIWGDVYGRFTP
jgi:FkbM family methyltransferase